MEEMNRRIYEPLGFFCLEIDKMHTEVHAETVQKMDKLEHVAATELSTYSVKTIVPTFHLNFKCT